MIQRDVSRLQRQLALRVIRGYRTISYDAFLLAGMVPFNLIADRLKRSYLRRRGLIDRNDFITPWAMNHIREEETNRSAK